jgi:hypothetical protein
MKTAVEWFEDGLTLFYDDAYIQRLLKEAKEIEKEQIIEHSVELTKILISNPFRTSGKTPTELMDNYFKETFKKQEQ